MVQKPADDPARPWVGIWRAHANVFRYMIDNNIASALVLEDDVDWDVDIKDVMGLWNWQLRYNSSGLLGGTVRDTNMVESDKECAYGMFFPFFLLAKRNRKSGMSKRSNSCPFQRYKFSV